MKLRRLRIIWHNPYVLRIVAFCTALVITGDVVNRWH